MDLFDVDDRTARLFVLGDVLAILAFVLVGELSHGIDPLARPLYVAETALPFVVGWAFAGSALGAYSVRARESLRVGLPRAFVAWLAADAVAQALRALPFFHGDAALTFYLVAAAFGGALLLGWRALATTVLAR
ncbi:DUF3054 domain-containing protein [Halospeciosus flavus]|uniref:DUF3054 domain-containing protein n=1 Tax=Halospeciosus flavus TaxID=3032283 RepID=A0ABD5Z282_9EURY|nr:DUF3054 domain-containing protein [Halospeciosus flavus]